MDEDRLWFIVADVSGKGVAAALYMAVTKTLFRAMVQAGIDVTEVLARMNRELCRDNDHLMFVTAIVGHLTLSTGEAVLADAGHNPALRVGHAGRLTKVALSKGVALGVVQDFQFSEQHLTLEPGGALVVYTDGATDARNPSGERFGATRLQEAIASSAMAPVDAIVDTIVCTVNAFENGTPPEDDLTVLALRYRGASA